MAVQFLRRTTRKVTVTDEGAKVFTWAQRILGDVEEMRDEVARGTPRWTCGSNDRLRSSDAGSPVTIAETSGHDGAKRTVT